MLIAAAPIRKGEPPLAARTTRSAWANPEGRLTIALPRPVPAGGTVVARISYRGTPHIAVRAPWDDGGGLSLRPVLGGYQ